MHPIYLYRSPQPPPSCPFSIGDWPPPPAGYQQWPAPDGSESPTLLTVRKLQTRVLVLQFYNKIHLFLPLILFIILNAKGIFSILAVICHLCRALNLFPELWSSITSNEAYPREALPKLSSWYDHLLLLQFPFSTTTNRLATGGVAMTALTMVASNKKRHSMGGGGSRYGSQGSDRHTSRIWWRVPGSGNAVPNIHISYQSNTYGRSGTEAQDRCKYNAEYSKGKSFCKARAIIHSVHIGFMAAIALYCVKCIPAQNVLTSPAFPQVRPHPDNKQSFNIFFIGIHNSLCLVLIFIGTKSALKYNFQKYKWITAKNIYKLKVL